MASPVKVVLNLKSAFLISFRPWQFRRSYSAVSGKGLVLGFYEHEKENVLPTLACEFIHNKNKLLDILKISGKPLKQGKCRVLHGLDKEYPSIALVCLGSKGIGKDELEERHEGKENIRAAVAAGTRQLQDLGFKTIVVDPCLDAQAAAEGSSLALFSYDELKQECNRKLQPELIVFDDSLNQEWQKGLLMAEGQNLARKLMEMPSNKLTPTIFSNITEDIFGKTGNVTVKVWDKQWVIDQKMGAFFSVAVGSDEPLKFLEISYKGTDAKPVALVGKGITFDTGGISIKPAQGMPEMRGDMGGAACTVGTILTAAKLKLPVNIIGLIPLCENMPSGHATKPGDVVIAMNGKTIQVDNTDAEGRLILADALCYAQKLDPQVILDMATLTGAMVVALGSAATGVFTNSSEMWQQLHKAGMDTGDRMWRMPLFKHYSVQVTESHLADVNNIGKHSRMGGACTAAAFLKEFVTIKNWLHLDIAGVMENKDEVPYLSKGMTGRPTRTIVEFLSRLAKD